MFDSHSILIFNPAGYEELVALLLGRLPCRFLAAAASEEEEELPQA